MGRGVLDTDPHCHPAPQAVPWHLVFTSLHVPGGAPRRARGLAGPAV